MSSYFHDVSDFHLRLGLPVSPERYTTLSRVGLRPPHLLDDSTYLYRLRSLEEELEEFKECHRTGDLEGAADALCDLIWVALGTAHYMHIPFHACWEEVRRANMEKERAPDGDDGHKRGAAERIRKPIGWQPPDHKSVFKKYIATLSHNGEK